MAALIVALEVGRAGASHGRDKNAKVTLVRTGKCASKTIETYLRDCRVQYQGIHVDEGPVRPKDVQGHKNIIALRDPVSRAISAFNWRHPAHGSALDHTGKDGVKFRASVVRAKAALAKAGHGTALVTEAMLYACFDHANDFANALDEPTACGYVARRALASPRAAGNVGSNSKGAEITGHLPRGFAYYLADVLHLLTATGMGPTGAPYFLLHVETLDNDLQQMVRWLGTACNIPVARAHTSKKENTSTGSSYTDVNATGLAKLRRHLASEYFVVGLLESAHAIHLLRPPGT